MILRRTPIAPARVRPQMWSALLLAAACLAAPPPARGQDELLLNDDRVARNQWAPQAARGSTGALVIAWMDGRNGSESFVDYDIYGMTVRDPSGLGTTLNRRINDDGPNATQSAPDLCGSPGGTLYCVWEDTRTGNPDIFAVALDSLGVRLTPNLRVNDDAGAADQRGPHVAAVGRDRFLVVWGDERAGESDVMLSYRTLAGAPIGANAPVSVDPVPGGSFQGEPAVACDSTGLTLVVWLDHRDGSVFGDVIDVYGQWLDGSGAPLGGNFRISEETAVRQCDSPTVAADGSGGFVVAWIDRRSAPADPGEVYAQRFGPDRSAIGPNVRVNDDPVGRDQRQVRAAAGGGVALLLWEDVRDNVSLDPNIAAAAVPYDGGSPGSNFIVNGARPGRQGTPGAVWDGRDAFLAVWEDGRNGPTDVYAVSAQPDGTVRGFDTQLNDDAAPYDQWRPRLGKGYGQFIASWLDRRSGRNDLFGQWVTATGGRDGVNFRIWRDDFDYRPLSSDAAVLPDGRGLCVAAITRPSDAGEIRAFLMPAVGLAPTASFWVTDSLPTGQAGPVAAPGPSEFAVAWIDARDATPRPYGQRLSPEGLRLGTTHPLLGQNPVDPVYALDLASDPQGGYWIAYAEGAGSDQRLWLAHLDANLLEDRASVEVAGGAPGFRADPSLSGSPDGGVEVVWTGEGVAGLGQIYYRSFTSALTPATPVLALGDPGDPGAKEHPSIARSGARSVVAWQGKEGADWSIWMQTLENGAGPSAGPLRVDQDVADRDQLHPSAGLDAAGHAIVIWADDRAPTNGSDVIARVYDFTPTSVTPPESAPGTPPPPDRALRVAPARPNPFSAALAIPIETAPGAEVQVEIFNVRGERVASLPKLRAPGGPLTIRWGGLNEAGRPLPSGVYWVRIGSEGDRRAVRVVHVR